MRTLRASGFRLATTTFAPVAALVDLVEAG